MRPSHLGINTKIANLVVRWRVTAVTLDSLDDGVEIIECGTPALALHSHTDTEITSRPLSIRIFHQPDLPVRTVSIARVGVCHTY